MYTAGGVGAAGIGGGALWWGLAGFDIISLAFVLRRKRDYVAGIDKLVEQTDFSDADARAAFLRNISEMLSGDDIENGYAARLGLKGNAESAAAQAEMVDKSRQALAEVKLDYEDGGQARAEGDRQAPTREDDRCVLSLLVTTKRRLARRLSGGDGGGIALATLSQLAQAGSAGADGVWVFYVPALDEPLPSDYAQLICSNFRVADNNWKPGTVRQADDHAGGEPDAV